uniref:Uncharacterized protein n=1 Tax=Glossina pallidipes TaxID=7398 RepID=A0A1B0A0Q8_GLOPL
MLLKVVSCQCMRVKQLGRKTWLWRSGCCITLQQQSPYRLTIYNGNSNKVVMCAKIKIYVAAGCSSPSYVIKPGIIAVINTLIYGLRYKCYAVSRHQVGYKVLHRSARFSMLFMINEIRMSPQNICVKNSDGLHLQYVQLIKENRHDR